MNLFLIVFGTIIASIFILGYYSLRSSDGTGKTGGGKDVEDDKSGKERIDR